jgi:CRP-like cAMP-binding protein
MIERHLIERHLMKLRARDEIGGDEEEAISALVEDVREVPAQRTMVQAEVPLTHSSLLLSGIAARAKDMRDGSRQITELHIDGDFVDLHSFSLKRLDHEVIAITDCRIACVAHDQLRTLVEEHPHLARVYWFSTNLDAAVHREWELSLGRRTALARTAHLFCELKVRLELVGLADGGGYALAMTQIELAECLGLTPVHVNRTLKQLREEAVVEFRSGRVAIQDWARLLRIAEFNPSYLYLEKRPR